MFNRKYGKMCKRNYGIFLTNSIELFYYFSINRGADMEYLPRLIEKEIELGLKTSGVVVVAGPKWCGKTETCKKYAKSKYVLDTKNKIELAESNPQSILLGDNPRLIDEWQNVPDLWNAVRSEVDNRIDKFGQFIFTGSSTPADKNDIYHSGAGRIVTIRMRPMSLYESKESKELVSLSNLFNGQEKVFGVNDNYYLQDTAFYICRGGWPLSLVNNREIALKITENYISTLFNFENSKNKKFRNKKPETFKIILRSYARNISTEARKKTILNDINSNDDRKLDCDTLDEYLQALKDLYIINDIEAWNPNFRSKTVIITSPTRHFVDTSIAAGCLNLSPDDLMNDPKTFGLFFEDFVVKELSIYTQAMNGEIKHFRDGNGLECDAVIHLKNGKYCLIEIKLGGEHLIDEGVSALTLLKNKIKIDKQNEPSFCMIVTASGDAYTTKEGIHVVPINMLKI